MGFGGCTCASHHGAREVGSAPGHADGPATEDVLAALGRRGNGTTCDRDERLGCRDAGHRPTRVGLELVTPIVELEREAARTQVRAVRPVVPVDDAVIVRVLAHHCLEVGIDAAFVATHGSEDVRSSEGQQVGGTTRCAGNAVGVDT